ncbi:uncharacterized protein LOC125139265 [Tachysurus ichikawai]
MNKAVVIFVDEIHKVFEIHKVEFVVAERVIKDTIVKVFPLSSPSRRVILSNVPPYIDNKALLEQLTRFGKPVSEIKLSTTGYKDPEMRHILSYRRYVYMILNNRGEDLRPFFLHFLLKCFGCGQEGHMFRNCPEKEVDGGQETEIQKDKDKHDSEDNSVQTERQEETKRQESNTEGQEGKEGTTGPEAEQMETGKEDPKVNNDNLEQNTEAVVHQSSEESVATDNTDLITAYAGFTVVRSKRKSKVCSSGRQTRKKGLVETGQEKQIVSSQEAVMESGSEQDTNTDTDSDEAKHDKEQAGTYTAKEIKRPTSLTILAPRRAFSGKRTTRHQRRLLQASHKLCCPKTSRPRGDWWTLQDQILRTREQWPGNVGYDHCDRWKSTSVNGLTGYQKRNCFY